MQLGPTKILHHPHSNFLVRLRTYRSGNNLGAVYWTDGEVTEAKHLPRQSLAYRNPSDGLLFWVDEAETVATQIDQELRREPDEYDHLPFVEELREHDYFHAIESGLADDFEPEDARNRLYYLRSNCWQRGNDPIRKDQSKSLSPKQKKNVEAFLEMHTTQSTHDRLLRAELLRHVRRFDEAMSELETRFPDDSSRDFMEMIFLNILGRDDKVTRLEKPPFPVVFE